jgi:FkbM family methyltransferase
VITFSGEVPWHMFGDIWRYQVYTRSPVRLAPSPRIIVDIGANVGFFTLYAASRWPKAVIHAYEPAPQNFANLMRNVELSKAERVVCHATAVTGKAGVTTLYLKQDSGWHSIWSHDAESEIRVSTTTLNDIVNEVDGPIDLLKLDCEGAEYEVFEAAESLLARSVQQIVMEYHELGDRDVAQLTKVLERAGFSLKVEPFPPWNTGMLYAMNQTNLRKPQTTKVSNNDASCNCASNESPAFS